MEGAAVVAIVFGVLAFAALGVVLIMVRGSGASGSMRDLMHGTEAASRAAAGSNRRKLYDVDEDEFDINTIKERTGHAKLRKGKEDLSMKLFRAGFYTADDRRTFNRARVILPLVLTPLFGLAAHFFLGKPPLTGLALLLGIGIGYAYPVVYVERKGRARAEDTLYYLPLVIEQISIGVSSALDIGPCIAEVVSMADERGSHNPVTELFIHVEKLMRSGLSLEESLLEVSEVNGQQELKHAFMFLAQCAKHGGEISKQLQELADATMTSRQVYVEGRIAALPVKATGPLATVFAGFFALLVAGLMVRLVEAFGGGVGGGG